MKRCKYYWRDPKIKKVRTSWGIELSEEEKYQLAKKNNKLLREQRLEQAKVLAESSSES